MASGIHRVVEESYRTFGRYTIGPNLVVCHCPCCMTEETEHALVTTPLREIPSALLAEYTNSAHVWDDDRVARELRYFLPRYFALIAANDPPDHFGIEICLRRLKDARWRTKWPAEEVDLIDSFFEEIMSSSLGKLELAKWPVGWRLNFRIEDVLTMVVSACGDIGRALAVWDRADDPPAAIHMAAARSSVVVQTGRTFYYSAHLEDHPEEADAIGAFLVRPEVDARIEAAVFQVDDPRIQQILSDSLG